MLDAPAPARGYFRPIIKAIRVHQWVKNVLVFIPLLLAHVLPWASPTARQQWIHALLGFAAFCFAASSIYVVNDWVDVESDRAHSSKRRRPFASGALPTRFGPAMVIALVLLAAACCLMLPLDFAWTLAVYVLLSTAYSFVLKQRLLIDVFALAGLYTLRLYAGSRAANVEISQWLLAFSLFLFVSLAFAKRYAELTLLESEGRMRASGRNYNVDDLRIIESTGPASGYLAVMVLALYINDTSSQASRLYKAPLFLWMLCPLLMYWITRVWFIARRKALDDDPILFALKDKVSWLTFALAACLVLLAWQPWITR